MNYYFEVWKKYAVFTGRSRRREYWMYVLFNFIASIIVAIIAGVLRASFLTTLYALATIIPSLAVGVRRLHDTNRSGWWILINLIPLVGTIIFIVFAATDSQPGDNKYGANPKGSPKAN